MEVEKDYNLSVGLRIRSLRENLNMTRDKFSELCDISESFLTAVENGNKGITTKTLYKICKSCNISSDYIVFGRESGFDSDAVIELINSLDEQSKVHALNILAEFAKAIKLKE